MLEGMRPPSVVNAAKQMKPWAAIRSKFPLSCDIWDLKVRSLGEGAITSTTGLPRSEESLMERPASAPPVNSGAGSTSVDVVWARRTS